jgi:transposase-like protein
VQASEQFSASSAGLFASAVTRLTEQWQGNQKAFRRRDLSQIDYAYVWADCVHVNIRLEEHKRCGVNQCTHMNGLVTCVTIPFR